jgi:hypothetical protein
MRTLRGRFLTSGECRLKAEECRTLALRTDRPEHLVMLDQIARLWAELAERIERQRTM